MDAKKTQSVNEGAGKLAGIQAGVLFLPCSLSCALYFSISISLWQFAHLPPSPFCAGWLGWFLFLHS